ncbi:MAG TPA: hypothetical protein VIX80_00895 [Candidatus Kapabacteria bacterium]
MTTFSRILVLLFLVISVSYLPGCSDDPPTDTNNNPHDSDPVVVTKPSYSLTSASGKNWPISSVPTLIYDTLLGQVDINIVLDSPVYYDIRPVYTLTFPLSDFSVGKHTWQPPLDTPRVFLVDGMTLFKWSMWGDSRESFEITAINQTKKTVSLKLTTPLNSRMSSVVQLVTLELKDIPYEIAPKGLPRLEVNVQDSLFEPKSTSGMNKDEFFYIYQIANSSRLRILYRAPAYPDTKRNVIDMTFWPSDSGVGTYNSAESTLPNPGTIVGYMQMYHNAVNPNNDYLLFYMNEVRPSKLTITRFDKVRREIDCEFEGELHDNTFDQWVPATFKITNKRWIWYYD